MGGSNGRRTPRYYRCLAERRQGQPHTPPWLEQHPCFFAQLVQVGESVPSQQRKLPDCGGGADTVMNVVRCKEPQAPVAVSVMVSEPERVPV